MNLGRGAQVLVLVAISIAIPAADDVAAALLQARVYWEEHADPVGDRLRVDRTTAADLASRGSLSQQGQHDLAYAMWSRTRATIALSGEVLAPGISWIKPLPSAPAPISLPVAIRPHTNISHVCPWGGDSADAVVQALLVHSAENVLYNGGASLGAWSMTSVRQLTNIADNPIIRYRGIYRDMEQFLFETPGGRVAKDGTLSDYLRGVLMWQAGKQAKSAQQLLTVALETVTVQETAAKGDPERAQCYLRLGRDLENLIEAVDDMAMGPWQERRVVVNGPCLAFLGRMDALRRAGGIYLPGTAVSTVPVPPGQPPQQFKEPESAGDFQRRMVDLSSFLDDQYEYVVSKEVHSIEDLGLTAYQAVQAIAPSVYSAEAISRFTLRDTLSKQDILTSSESSTLEELKGNRTLAQRPYGVALLGGPASTQQRILSILNNTAGPLGGYPRLACARAPAGAEKIRAGIAMLGESLLDDWKLVLPVLQLDPTRVGVSVPRCELTTKHYQTEFQVLTPRLGQIKFVPNDPDAEQPFPVELTESWRQQYVQSKSAPVKESSWSAYNTVLLHLMGGDEMARLPPPPLPPPGTIPRPVPITWPETELKASGVMAALDRGVPGIGNLTAGKVTRSQRTAIAAALGCIEGFDTMVSWTAADRSGTRKQVIPTYESFFLTQDASIPTLIPPLPFAIRWNPGSKWTYWRIYSHTTRVADAAHRVADELGRLFWVRLARYRAHYERAVVQAWLDLPNTERPEELPIMASMRDTRLTLTVLDDALRAAMPGGQHAFVDMGNPRNSIWELQYIIPRPKEILPGPWTQVQSKYLSRKVANLIRDVPQFIIWVGATDLRLDILARSIAMTNAECLGTALMTHRDIYEAVSPPANSRESDQNTSDE